MANVLVEENSLTAIANSIRGKNGTTNTYKPGEMAAAIDAIETGGNGVFTVNTNMVNTIDTKGTGSYAATEAIIAGWFPTTLNSAANQYIWKKSSTADIWPINNYHAKWDDGERYSVYFYIWCSAGTIEWSNNNVYVNGNFTYNHSLPNITTTPQLVAFDFLYQDSGSQYDPTIHIYPKHSANPTSGIYVSPILIINDNESKYSMPIKYQEVNMKTKEQLLLEIKGVLNYKPGDEIIVSGIVYETPYDMVGIQLENEVATVVDLVVPGYYGYEIAIGIKHYFCNETSIKK